MTTSLFSFDKEIFLKNQLNTLIARQTAVIPGWEAFLKDCLEKISLYSPEEFSLYISDAPPNCIYLLSQTATFEIFFKKQNMSLIECWQETLKTNSYYDEKIESLDKVFSCSIYDLYLSIFLIEEYELVKPKNKNEKMTPDAEAWLNEACKHHSFQALKARSEYYQLEIVKEETDDRDKTILLNKMLRDIDELGGLYQTVGYMQGAILLHNLATYYESKDPIIYGGLATTMREFAIGSYFSGLILLQKNLESNQKMIQVLLKDKSLAEKFGVNSWEKAGELVFANKKREDYSHIYELFQNEITGLIQAIENQQNIS